MAEQKILYGGQAVIEGVMMRGRRFVACAVRRERGDILLHHEPLPHSVYAGAWSRIPFLRAVTVLSDTLVLGTRMLMYSANIQMADELEKDAQVISKRSSSEQAAATVQATGTAAEKVEQALPPAAIYGMLTVSLAFGIGLFFVVPLAIVSPFEQNISPFVSSLLEGLIRLALFLGYLTLISRIENVRRIFQYHGAEHKTIAAFEAGSELTPAKIQPFHKEHPRCGTGFLLTVVVVSIFVFALLGPLPLLLRLASRIVLIPVVAALSYELIRLSSQHRDNPLLDWLVTRPSLALQSLTTREPSDEMIEVAVAAFQGVRDREVENG